MKRIGVLGAGIQGSCVALELARRGYRVDLLDKNELAVSQASLQNEGKIHLGFVYASDSSLRTASRMLEGSRRFASLLSVLLRATGYRLLTTSDNAITAKAVAMSGSSSRIM